MFITVPDSVITQILQESDRAEGLIYGHLLDSGDVAQIIGITEAAGLYLGRWQRAGCTESGGEISIGELRLLVEDVPPLRASASLHTTDGWHPIACDVIRLHADYTARLRGLFEADRLANTCVAVIGLGSGGSVVASQLARCGVGTMRLVDFDRLEVHNIARHACGLRDIGRYKTRAMRDLLLDISPAIQVETYEINVMEDTEALEKVVVGCDLVVAATDKEDSKLAINAASWPRGIPAVYGAAYNRAFGGDVFRAIPPDGACYTCFQAVVSEFFGPPPAATTDFSAGYEDPSRMADLIAEPGLGMDVGMIALLMARVSLMTLLRNSDTTLPDMPTNWLLFGNRAEWIFEKPLESIFIDVPKRADCPTCNYQTYVANALQMSVAEVASAAESILADVPDVQSQIKRHP
jgi:ThiF family